ncbi:MAG: type II toxin-antitoxin system Phd/YefM family antitoxin [Desulfobulbaceae bacterium]|nr:type II toxin-antitoxin system Phd/YefM family antitoxin [Desulfobulbaceae bacterium]
MHTVNMHEASTRLPILVKETLAGEELIIAKAGKPVVKLVPVSQDSGRRLPGRYKGQIVIAADFDATPEEVVAAFEGDSS